MPASGIPPTWGRRLLRPMSLIGRLRKARGSSPRTATITIGEDGDDAEEPLRGPASLQLPLELWAEVLAYIEHPATLARMACICQPLQSEVEAILYRAVSLSFHYNIVLFHRTITSSPRLASLVRRYDVSTESQIYTRVPPCILETVEALPQLQRLAIRCDLSALDRASYRPIFAPYRAIFALRFPDLREFGTNLSLLLCPQILSFVASHTDLRVLEMEMWDPTRIRIPDIALLGSLRTLACFPRLLRSLVCLYDTVFLKRPV